MFFRVIQYYYFSNQDREDCQNIALILSRILSARFGMPVSRTLPPDTDHVEIVVGIYSPGDLKGTTHQTFLKVYLQGKAFYLDPTYLRYWRGEIGFLLREYPMESFNQRLAADLKIEPYDQNHRAYTCKEKAILGAQYTDPVERGRYVANALDILHDPKLVQDRDGDLFAFNPGEWTKMDAVISIVEPKGKLPSLMAELDRAALEYHPGILRLAFGHRSE
ncbi:hypothetical protein A2291_07475 [candidate division WOR-1 bacterium RIFOXYB2_FULL_42_35]|uniref:Uncharacterized protein n=1 Tax=candidate division WOR-1 bacterium RIFOXYC2_FULL_41_25 TaxID=1802586 RepID=A0A1F4TKN4_UNCSA|nr:MAG: hypothetical protein A2247_04335 [candidate division WOR-1 bacterium RIFOXYA2_FULL_41_14]OGC22746.1 MAG: hypothetical protein A2291_07475 [candidate division WOR-1 bacterium RIFOXYB2_FULL_42_35]OGC33167.1 MAG: hypothetical protein A2462_06370 [candidate division WOR-1 bacterium RIFOXYC2_FULL_41_25]